MTAQKDATTVHLVLGAGGVRTLSYIGAIETLERANIKFKSISACSAGCLVGAVLATGLPMREVKQRIIETDLRLLISKPRLPKVMRPLLFLTGLRWPFAQYDSSGVLAFMDQILAENKDITFGELKIPFATPVIDIFTKRLCVYSSEEKKHATMKVAEAVQIAVGVFPLYAPLYLPDEERMIVDAAVASECPVWMVGRFDDGLPIYVLRATTKQKTKRPLWLPEFLQDLIEASAYCQDQYLIDQIPRVYEIAIDGSDYGFADIQKAQRTKHHLFNRGSKAAEAFLSKFFTPGGSRTSAPQRPQRSKADSAERMATAMMEGFANQLSQLSRKKIFLSYSHHDREWMEVIKSALDPYVGMHVWDDTQIEQGSIWSEDITAALAQTRIALLLVSEHFLRSNFIQEKELAYFLSKRGDDALEIRWVQISRLNQLENPLAKVYQGFNDNAPLDELNPRELVSALAAIGKDLALGMR